MESSNRGEEPRTRVLFHPNEVLQALGKHTFLASLGQAQLAILAQIAQPVEFRDQELVLSAGQRSLDLYLMLSGSVSVELNNKHYAVRIQSLGPGDAFGWSALLEHHDTLFDVRAREHCTALRLEGSRLARALQQHPALAAELLRRTLRLVAGRLQATETRLGELCGVRMRAKVSNAADTTIQALNKLIEVCLDGELGYRTAAQQLQSSTLRIILTNHALRRAQFAEELCTEVRRLGGNPSNSGSLVASLHRGWMALRSAISGGNAKAIIAACETGEGAAHASYQAALNSDFLQATTRPIIEEQSRAVDQSCEWLREIYKELTSDAFLSQEQHRLETERR